jgi:hypothetical protein
MELDSKNLGRLRRVANARDVWTSESGDFTPWLAQNIDVLADELGIALTVTGTEVLVGECRLDIRAEDEEGRVVVIENQLERTDHGHLGQCIVYASGLEAATVVWISPQFREDFRRAFDWLNERTDLGVAFFGVEVGVVQIGDEGPLAPVFEVVARPNDWQKAVKAAAGGVGSAARGTVTPLNARRQDFYADLLSAVVAEQPAIRLPARGRDSWIAFASGPFGYWAVSQASDGRLRLEAYLDTGDKTLNKRLFDEFASSADRWNNAVGMELSWERLDDRRASRIAAYHPLALDDEVAREAARQWAVSALLTPTVHEMTRADPEGLDGRSESAERSLRPRLSPSRGHLGPSGRLGGESGRVS